MTSRLFAVSEAYYLRGGDLEPIAGVPEHDMMYFGEYSGKTPRQASSKAFTGLQKHMKKFHKTGKWFPDYDPDRPPEMVFQLVDVESREFNYYHGVRVPAHQGNRKITNADGRVREYRWDNKVTKIDEKDWQ
jgi:hypothetical protein